MGVVPTLLFPVLGDPLLHRLRVDFYDPRLLLRVVDVTHGVPLRFTFDSVMIDYIATFHSYIPTLI